MALAEDAIGKIRRKIKIRGKGFLRFCEEPRGEEQADESPQLERSLPATVHTGTLNDAVHLMQDGDMHRTGRPRPPGIPGSKG